MGLATGNRRRIVQKLRTYVGVSAAGVVVGFLFLGFVEVPPSPHVEVSLRPHAEVPPSLHLVTANSDTLEAEESTAVDATGDSPLAVAVHAEPESPDPEPDVEISHVLEEGRASYYGAELGGRPTANGERFDPSGLTAAHPNLPFGTRLRVTSLRTGRSVIVRINDRGPYSGKRVLDLSYAAADSIGMIRRGTARVKMEVLR